MKTNEKRRVGRPATGKTCVIRGISFDENTLDKVDEIAAYMGCSRSMVVDLTMQYFDADAIIAAIRNGGAYNGKSGTDY